MEIWINSLIQASSIWTLFAIFVISFFESLAFIGFLLPGAILMTSIGTIIGRGYLKFYPAWCIGFLGCVLGDSLSYLIGCKLKNKLYNWNLFKKHISTINKISQTIHNHYIFSIFFGRFLGHTRPLIPLVAGVMKLPLKNFFIPNILACFFWPPFYFIPGILAVVSVDTNKNNLMFNVLLLLIIILFFLGIWFYWKLKNKKKYKKNYLYKFIPWNYLKWLAPIITIVGFLGIIIIQLHPTMLIIRHELYKIFSNF